MKTWKSIFKRGGMEHLAGTTVLAKLLEADSIAPIQIDDRDFDKIITLPILPSPHPRNTHNFTNAGSPQWGKLIRKRLWL